MLRYVGVDVGSAHRAGEGASRWHVVKVFGVLQIVGRAELFVFGQSEEADILAICRLVVFAQFGQSLAFSGQSLLESTSV